MNLLLERITADDDSSIGTLYRDGKFHCFTCEDEYRAEKVAKETRIPAGTYEIKLRAVSGMATRYRSKLGSWHEGMLHLQDVPGFEWIYIHIGNTDDHTEGCILVGYGATAKLGSGMTVQSSTDAYIALAKACYAAWRRGEGVSIEIVDRDR